MDRLQQIFERQQAFNEELVARRHLEGVSDEQWIQKQVLAMMSELSEVLSEVNFKWWKNPRPVNPDNLKEELVDVFHFFIGMCLSAGMTADELYERYLRKNQENFDRQHGRSEKKGYEVEDEPG